MSTGNAVEVHAYWRTMAVYRTWYSWGFHLSRTRLEVRLGLE